MPVDHADRGAPDEQRLAVGVDRPRLLRGAAGEQHRLGDLDLAAEDIRENPLERLAHVCDHRRRPCPLSSRNRFVERRARVRAFMDEHVYPNEPRLFAEDEAPTR